MRQHSLDDDRPRPALSRIPDESRGERVLWWVTAPVRLTMATMEWLVVELIARLIALPALLVVAVRAHVQLAAERHARRLREEQRRSDALVLVRHATARTDAIRTTAIHAIRAIDDLDRRQARIDVHFRDSLASSIDLLDRAKAEIVSDEDVPATSVVRQSGAARAI